MIATHRLPAVRIQLGTPGALSANSCLVYNYYSDLLNPANCAIPAQGTTNNGNVFGYFFQDTSNPSLGHTASYTYDTVNRLATSVVTGSATHNLTFGYDRYGNMTCVTNAQTQGLCPNWSYSPNTSTNQITTSGFTYDAAGNLTADGTRTYQWDAEGRLKSINNGTTASFTYNALGQRAEKVFGTARREYQYDALGGLILITDGSVPAEDLFPLVGGRNYAKYQDAKTYFMHGNPLGSTTLMTDQTGAVVQDMLYYPWGQRWSLAGIAKDERFASLQKRDAESALDPTLFRMYSSTQGRWLSPDPLAGDITNPQSLNRYAYVTNNHNSHEALRPSRDFSLAASLGGREQHGRTNRKDYRPSHCRRGSCSGLRRAGQDREPVGPPSASSVQRGNGAPDSMLHISHSNATGKKTSEPLVFESEGNYELCGYKRQNSLLPSV